MTDYPVATDRPVAVGKKLKVSFCTSCRERLSDLKRTLSVNLAFLAEGEEIVLLDYNSAIDGLRVWVLDNFSRDLEAGRLRLFSERSASRFYMAHAKNVSHLLGRGDVLVNLDADNYLDRNYLDQLRAWVTDSDSHMLYPLKGSGGFKGRTAIWQDTFRQMGGYDEDFNLGYGYEEIDLYRRLLAAAGRARHIVIDPVTAIPTPDAMKAAGQLDPDTKPIDTSLSHRRMCEANLRQRRLVANRGRRWGEATLLDQHRQTIAIGAWSHVPA